jgi:hypothetical protein
MSISSSLYRRISILIALIGTLIAMMSASASAVAASPAPAFTITSTVSPSHLSPAGEESGYGVYAVVVTNIGAVPTDGSPIIVTDTLPTGFSVDPTPANFGLFQVKFFEDFESGNPGSCETGTTITCTAPATVLQPGRSLKVIVPIDFPPGLSGTVLNRVAVNGGGAAAASAAESTPVSAEAAPFDFQSSETAFTGPGGAPFVQAGGHPYQFHVRLQTNSVLEGELGSRISGSIKDVLATLPPGMIVDTNTTPARCTEAQLEASSHSECPTDSAVGVVRVSINGAQGYPYPFITEPVYNMVPSRGHPAELAFDIGGFSIFAHVFGGVDSAGDYQLTAETADILQYASFSGVNLYLWGNPSDASHDYVRGECAYPSPPSENKSCPTERVDAPLLTMPTSCSANPLTTALSIDSWEQPGAFVGSEPSTADAEGNPVGVEGCSALQFAPTISSQPTTNLADSPTGINVSIHQPQSNSYKGLSTANLKDVKVTLPAGMALNPSAASGLAACTNAQIGYQPVGAKIRFAQTPQSCPDASKLGTLEVDTPLLAEKLPGTIYLAKPYENPFGNLTAIYLAIESPKLGIIVKLAGKVEADPVTGQLTAIFTENPQLPIEDIETHFFEGPRAALVSPFNCGTATTTTDLTPWSTPEGADAHPASSFQTSVAASGSGLCPSSEAQAPKNVSFTAGTANPLSGAYSPFVLRIARPDGTQHITGVEATLPEGLIGNLAGISYCPESGIAQARSREAPEQGKLEQASPSCPASSEVGTVQVTAGAGISPIAVSGHAYLAGPYKGAPLSMVVIVPAVAGPFDLGTVVDRIALKVGEYDARIHAVADPLPTIRDGIPLDVRSIEAKLDRSSFTVNPTSCDAMAIEGSVTTQAGQTAPLNNRFQVGECGRLGFKPKLTASTSAKASKANGASLVVKIASKTGEANIHKVNLQLPLALPSRLTTLQKACTEAVFNANPAACPAESVIGSATAHTPILQVPLSGPAYLVSHGGAAFPDVEFVLQADERGGDIEIILDGGTQIKKGITYSNFETVPDAPITSFETVLPTGPHSILTANLPTAAKYNLCGQSLLMPTTLTGQNGAVLKQSTPIAVTGCAPAIRVTKHTVKGNAATFVVSVPAAGKLTAKGAGLTSAAKTVSAAKSVTLKVKLNKKEQAFLARHRHRKLKLHVKLQFTPKKGAKLASSATVLIG